MSRISVKLGPGAALKGVIGAQKAAGTANVAEHGIASGEEYVLPGDRSTIWTPGVPGGVPSYTSIWLPDGDPYDGYSVDPALGDGETNAATAINAALVSAGAVASAETPKVVLLAAGEYVILQGTGIFAVNLASSYVVLRGSGETSTKLLATVGSNYLPVGLGNLSYPSFGTSIALAANAVKGEYSVELASTPSLTAGQLVSVDQLTDADFSEWSETAPPGAAARGWFCRFDRPTGQIMEVDSVDGNVVTLTTPFHMAFLTANTAQMTPIATASTVKYSGIEDLYIYGGSLGNGNIRVCGAYLWIKNIESDYHEGSAIDMRSTFRCVLRDSYIHSTQNPNPGGGGYALSLMYYASENLVENNITWNMNKVMVCRCSGGGNVFGYNYMEDGWISYNDGWVETGLNASHMPTPHFELFEGNQSFNFDGDSSWGNSIYIVAFRNHLTGHRRSISPLDFEDVYLRRCIGLGQGHWWYTLLGNVLGTADQDPAPYSGYTYEDLYPWGNEPVAMYRLGYNDRTWGPADTKVTSTVIRHGNFDYVTNTVIYNGDDKQVLPNSLYLSSKPSFFGSNTWPWVEAAGATKTYTLPARARFDTIHGL